MRRRRYPRALIYFGVLSTQFPRCRDCKNKGQMVPLTSPAATRFAKGVRTGESAEANALQSTGDDFGDRTNGFGDGAAFTASVVLICALCTGGFIWLMSHSAPAPHVAYRHVDSEGSPQIVSVTADVARIRREPSSNATITGLAKRGEIFTVQQAVGDWYQVEPTANPGVSGYLHRSVVAARNQ